MKAFNRRSDPAPIADLTCRMRSSVCQPTSAAHHLQVPQSLGQLALRLNCIAKALSTGAPRWNCWWTGRSRHSFYFPGRRPHRARETRREGHECNGRSVPVVADTGAGHGSAEQLRLMHDSSGLVAATRRTLPLPFQYTRATGSHFPTAAADSIHRFHKN